MTAKSPLSTATQKLALVHDTELRVDVSGCVTVDQLVPWCVTTWPVLSTAAQKLAVGHEIDFRLFVPSMVPGAVQLAANAVPEPRARKATATPAPTAKKEETRWRRCTALPPSPRAISVYWS